LDDPLIWMRAVHFAATILVAGTIFFRGFVAEPAFGFASNNSRCPPAVRSQLAWLEWTGLGLLLVTGAMWLVLISEQMVDLPLGAVLSQGMVWTVLWGTDFGHDWGVRLILAVLLAGTLARCQFEGKSRSRPSCPAAVVLAAGLVGTLAWAGHAAANSSVEGNVHLFADVLHLIAAAAWLGALVPLALLLRAVRGDQNETSVAIGRAAALRFSTLGIASVGTLTATGVANSWVLVGSVAALTDTDYGQLLMVKIGLFFVMLSIAAANRLLLTPRLTQTSGAIASHDALQQIERNTLIEASVGAIIIVIVAALGILPPGAEQAAN
jgi:putative copper resistance protein D